MSVLCIKKAFWCRKVCKYNFENICKFLVSYSEESVCSPLNDARELLMNTNTFDIDLRSFSNVLLDIKLMFPAKHWNRVDV